MKVKDEETKEVKVGDIRPIFQQIGFEVCKKVGDDQEWIQTERQSEAEILSDIFKRNNKELNKSEY